MKPKCEWILKNQKSPSFIEKVIKIFPSIGADIVCEMPEQDHYYKHEGKIYCIFHSPLDGVNLKTGKKKSEEIKEFQEALNFVYYH